jgi:hypothetical protein
MDDYKYAVFTPSNEQVSPEFNSEEEAEEFMFSLPDNDGLDVGFAHSTPYKSAR